MPRRHKSTPAVAAPPATEPSLPFTTCVYPASSIISGPRVPHRWGSGPTQTCTRCGGWRATLHAPGPWWPGPVDDVEEDDDC